MPMLPAAPVAPAPASNFQVFCDPDTSLDQENFDPSGSRNLHEIPATAQPDDARALRLLLAAKESESEEVIETEPPRMTNAEALARHFQHGTLSPPSDRFVCFS